jgi:hypothetical protein
VLKTYLVFEPEGARTAETAERVVFVREKFHWLALLFAPLWLLLNRLWLALVFWCAAAVLIAAVCYGFAMSAMSAVAPEVAYLLPSLIVAFEGAALKRFRLRRKGYRETGVVYAESLEAAERRFFERWKQPDERAGFAPPPASPTPTPTPIPALPDVSPANQSVLGLFPRPGSGR